MSMRKSRAKPAEDGGSKPVGVKVTPPPAKADTSKLEAAHKSLESRVAAIEHRLGIDLAAIEASEHASQVAGQGAAALSEPGLV